MSVATPCLSRGALRASARGSGGFGKKMIIVLQSPGVDLIAFVHRADAPGHRPARRTPALTLDGGTAPRAHASLAADRVRPQAD